ncbi:MAG TPA: glycosyltransferase family 2 protein [Pyrinomonadaceae bacterium]|nr:glycosyltransferase family 2 protein [Pyrinomonadaceae bacterium]
MIQTTKQIEVSVVVISFNTRDLLRECLTTLAATSADVSYELIVVDNASRDDSAAMVALEFPEAKLIRSEVNLGFGGANNLGFAAATGRYVVLLNSDAFLKVGTLRKSIDLMDSHPQVGLAGAKLIGRDDSLQPSARMFPNILQDFLILSGLADRYSKSRFFGRGDRTWADPNKPAEVDWVPGAFGIIRREALERTGFFDPRFFLYYEEVDLCKRIKQAGYSIWYWPELEVVHIGGESSKTLSHLSLSSAGSQLTLWRMRSALLFYRKHHGLRGAWLAMKMEQLWHQLRSRKNFSSTDADRRAKATESQSIANLMRQAWLETERGLTSPPQPW